ncbi:MAG: hypothetical protein J2P52_17565 [Blastocatellia bacterium]|nr:hypothetical protein [Blastocatellia bacterium]MBO0857195.1 hypothetical protein [Chloracidobacterium sp.]
MAAKRNKSKTDPPARPRYLSRALRQWGEAMIHQCWNWGYDIRREEGNLLLEYGFAAPSHPRRVGGDGA